MTFDIKASTMHHTRIRIRALDLELFANQLHAAASQAPKFFQNSNIVLDFSLIKSHSIDIQTLAALQKTLQRTGACLTGIYQPSSSQTLTAQEMNIPIIYEHRKQNDDKARLQLSPEPTVVKKVRSGSEVQAAGDLIVLGNVAYGASVQSMHNIHIYGKLEGKASFGHAGGRDYFLIANQFLPEVVHSPTSSIVHSNIDPKMLGRSVYCKHSTHNQHLSLETLATPALVK